MLYTVPIEIVFIVVNDILLRRCFIKLLSVGLTAHPVPISHHSSTAQCTDYCIACNGRLAVLHNVNGCTDHECINLAGY